MMDWQAFADHTVIRALGWALLNFIWQGALVALVLKCLLTAIRRNSINLGYWTATATLLLMLAPPLLSFWKPHIVATMAAHSVAARSPETGSIDAAPPAAYPEVRSVPALSEKEAMAEHSPTWDVSRVEAWLRDAPAVLGQGIPWICLIWITGVILACLRTCGGVIVAHRLKQRTRELPVQPGQALLIRKAGIHTGVRLLESVRVGAPTVIGWLRPAVLLPAAASALEPGQADALLAHELAHIRRRDYLVNFLQAGVEILLFFHPAVWWISAQVRSLREHCCDDAAVALCGDLRIYLHALSEAEHRRSATRLAIAASGTPLLDRIRRLTEMTTQQKNRRMIWSTGIIALFVMGAAVAGSGLMAYVPVQIDKPASATNPSVAPATSEMSALKAGYRPAAPKQVPAAAVKPVSIGAPQVLTKSEPFANSVRVGRQEVHPEALQARLAALDASHLEGIRPKQMSADEEPLLPDRTQAAQTQEKFAGTVLDPAGAVIPGVTISILDPKTRDVLATVVTTANGTFETVPPQANFLVQVTFPAFQSQVYTRAQLGPSPVLIGMELGQVQETVTVITGAPSVPAGRQARQPIRVGGNVFPPRLIQKVDPVYPPEARDAGIEGIVVVSALIDEEGGVKDPVILQGNRLLHVAALAAVQQWRYSPSLLNGQPWRMRLSIKLIFKLERNR